MSTIKLNTDCICLGHLASNGWSIQENNARLAANRSARTIVAIYTVIILIIQLPGVNCSFIFFVCWYFKVERDLVLLSPRLPLNDASAGYKNAGRCRGKTSFLWNSGIELPAKMSYLCFKRLKIYKAICVSLAHFRSMCCGRRWRNETRIQGASINLFFSLLIVLFNNATSMERYETTSLDSYIKVGLF